MSINFVVSKQILDCSDPTGVSGYLYRHPRPLQAPTPVSCEFCIITCIFSTDNPHAGVKLPLSCTVRTVPLTLNLTHACVHTRACTRLTRVKVNNLVCIVSAAREFGVRINARGTLDMHDTNTPATCTRVAL